MNIRKCKICKILKPFELMVKNAKKCKECKNKERRTGKPVGRKKGYISEKRDNGNLRRGWTISNWVKNIKERDNYICQHCGNDDKSKMQAHHIVPWKDSEELRFELSNGLTLCRSCHKKEDRKIHPEILLLRSKSRSEETKIKISESLKGNVPWNKGLKGKQVAWNKGLKITS